ncbi:hypothetical protein [Paludisphaera soli]|uniref:hypothetical protein n=1 Tax=Paludisphaera soli TaxID=2712865 RepID=UPI0013ECC187|nr:hypothetical protein [Paludisphaera soli]
MRIGIRLGGAMFGVVVALYGASARADATERVVAVPLGGSLEAREGEHYYGVYVPTRFGGELTIKATEGVVEEIKGPNGAVRANGQEVGEDQQGWFTFKVTGAKKPYKVETKFIQNAQSLKKPWNFYYWPTKADSLHEPWAGGNARVDTIQLKGDDVWVASPGGYIEPGKDIVMAGRNGLLETTPAAGDDATWFPNLYDDLYWLGPNNTLFQTPSPLLKYDQLFGTSARIWEAVNTQNNDISRWPGHCLGGAVASIRFNDPIPAPGTGLTKDELKALYAELGENHLNHRIGDYATDIPSGPPRPGPDPTDWKVSRVHAMYETHIRGERIALLSNMRAFPPRGTEAEVWNQAIYKYVAEYKSIPGRGPRAVKINIQVHANSGSSLNGQDDKDRVVHYEYNLVYGLDGRVDETNPAAADWISVGGEALFAPLNVLQVLDSQWAGHNPYVTLANVQSLDLANGGSSTRFAGKAPEFLPVAQYEAGRTLPGVSAPMFAGSNGGTDGGARRGGFLGFFRGR